MMHNGHIKADGREEDIDLSHAFDATTIYWPTASGFALVTDFKGTTQGGFYYEANTFGSVEHGGLHPDAAQWLVDHRAIHAIGLDTASIDYGQSAGFESHRILMARNIPAFENVASMDELPSSGFQIIALPMKITGGSGGPLRIVALVP